MSVQTDPALREHPNRVDWNARYERAGSAHAPFAPVLGSPMSSEQAFRTVPFWS